MRWLKTIDDLKRHNYDFFVDALPRIAAAQIPRLYTDYNWNLGRTHCPYVEPTIDADGNVYPCNLFTESTLPLPPLRLRAAAIAGKLR